jgi:hypothetical protein
MPAPDKRGAYKATIEIMLRDYDLIDDRLDLRLRGLGVAVSLIVLAKKILELHLHDEIVREGCEIAGRAEGSQGSIFVVLLVAQARPTLGLISECQYELASDVVARNGKPVLGLPNERFMAGTFSIHIFELGTSRKAQEDDLENGVIGVLDVSSIARELQRRAEHFNTGVDRLAPVAYKAAEDHYDLAPLNYCFVVLG